MKITFIRPGIGRVNPEKPELATIEPLSLALLSAMTPPEIDRAFYDDRIENIPFDEPTDFAVLTVETFTAKRAWEISAEYKRRGVMVIAGGIHVSLIPSEALMNVNSICINDAESVWAEILDDMATGNLKPWYQGNNGEPQNGFLPDRRLFKGKKYLPLSLVQFSRGCPYSCNFCAPAVYFDRKMFHRQIDSVIKEISEQKLKNILFVDDNITANQERATELFQELAKLKIRWGSQGSIEMTRNKKLMEAMAKSGCIGHVLGVESIDKSNLLHINKIPNLNQDIDTAIDIFRDFGFQSWAALTVGHDNDTPDTIRNLVDYVIRKKFAFAAVNMLVPYPGTELYKQLSSGKRLAFSGKWWLHPEYQYNEAPFIPARMTRQQLTTACADGWEKFYSHSSIASRSFDFKTNLSSPFRAGIFLVYNYIFRWEYYRTNFMKFGLEHHYR
ncbi:MAG: radical SAM protein [Deltaproteobacteria bacterium]|nr:radical SAM protein [Deltaproteobacteria bacterium]